jgi:hypothetical protein
MGKDYLRPVLQDNYLTSVHVPSIDPDLPLNPHLQRVDPFNLGVGVADVHTAVAHTDGVLRGRLTHDLGP